MQTGDLIYAPSSAYLYKIEGGVPIAWKKLDEPMSIIICGQADKFYKVFYQGATWCVLKKEVTLLQRGNNDHQTNRGFREHR